MPSLKVVKFSKGEQQGERRCVSVSGSSVNVFFLNSKLNGVWLVQGIK